MTTVEYSRLNSAMSLTNSADTWLCGQTKEQIFIYYKTITELNLKDMNP